MINTKKYNYADFVGIASSSICLVHCIATPILIVCTKNCCDENPVLKYTFLIVAFISIFKTTENATKTKTALLLWVSFWGFLFSTLFQEEYNWLHYLAYFFSASIIVGHILNIKYCKQCKNNNCNED